MRVSVVSHPVPCWTARLFKTDATNLFPVALQQSINMIAPKSATPSWFLHHFMFQQSCIRTQICMCSFSSSCVSFLQVQFVLETSVHLIGAMAEATPSWFLHHFMFQQSYVHWSHRFRPSEVRYLVIGSWCTSKIFLLDYRRIDLKYIEPSVFICLYVL